MHAQFNGRPQVPTPINEPVRQYAPHAPERASLKAKLAAMAGETIDMPVIIGGKECRTGQTAPSPKVIDATPCHALANSFESVSVLPVALLRIVISPKLAPEPEKHGPKLVRHSVRFLRITNH